jgi:hypothetical protein
MNAESELEMLRALVAQNAPPDLIDKVTACMLADRRTATDAAFAGMDDTMTHCTSELAEPAIVELRVKATREEVNGIVTIRVNTETEVRRS